MPMGLLHLAVFRRGELFYLRGDFPPSAKGLQSFDTLESCYNLYFYFINRDYHQKLTYNLQDNICALDYPSFL